MPDQSEQRLSALVVLSLSVVVALLLLVLPLALSGPLTLETDASDAHIVFSADPGLVFSPGACVRVRWEVSNIREVYLNGRGKVGAGEQELCIDDVTLPTLRVVLQDGSSEQFRLDVGIVTLNPLAWLLVLAALTLACAALYLTLARRLGGRLQPTVLRLRPILRGLGLMVFGVGLALLLIEVGLRVYVSNFGTERERALYLYSGEQIRVRNERFVGMPFLEYLTAPGEANALGYRGKAVDIPKPDGMFRIVAIGGSTTFGLGMRWQQAWPAQLETILRADYGYSNIEVINAGVQGYNTWNSLVNLAFRVLEVEPDLIIIFHATNDVNIRGGAHPDCYQRPSPYLGLTPRGGVWKQNLEDPGPSALYRFVAINLGWMDDPTNLESQFESIPCPTDERPDPAEALAANPPTYFERNLRSMIGIAQANGVQPVLSSWTYLRDSNLDERPEWWRQGVDEHNAIIERLAGEYDIPFYDLAANFPLEPDWWVSGGIHMEPAGTHEQARQYAAFLVDAGLLPHVEN